MITHYIYEIPGVKIGCTKNIEGRKSLEKSINQKHDYSQVIIIKELYDKTDKEAGEIERELQKEYGYPIDKVLYENSLNSLKKMGSHEDKVKAGKKGIQQTIKNNPNHQYETSKRAYELNPNLGIEIRDIKLKNNPNYFSDIAKVGNQLPSNLCQQRGVCPHCGMESNMLILKGYHFDKCKKKK